MNVIDRFRAYLAKCPGAVSGQGGHPATFAVCCRAVEFGLTLDEAMPLLQEWNERCEPRWTEGELLHKLRSAFNRTQPKRDFANLNATARIVSRVPAPKPSLTIAASIPPVDLRVCELSPGTDSQVCTLALLRRVTADAVRLTVSRALLRFGKHYGTSSWFVTDTFRRCAIVRRTDGERWRMSDGREAKAVFVRGSDPSWLIGASECVNFPFVALVEGGPDLIAAHELILREGREHDCAAVAMASSSPQIHADALPHFKGKRVRIFTHADENGAGEKAAKRWAAQLVSVGASVDGYFCGHSGCKDLNDLTTLPDFNKSVLP